jgi:hypothetical protein
MQTDDPAKLDSAAKQMEGSALSALTHDAENKSVQLKFNRWDGRSISVECRGVIHCNVSAVGLDGDSEVIGASIQCVENGILDHLEGYGYLWKLQPESAKNIQGRWLHLSINGDTCTAVICKEIAFN